MEVLKVIIRNKRDVGKMWIKQSYSRKGCNSVTSINANFYFFRHFAEIGGDKNANLRELQQ